MRTIQETLNVVLDSGLYNEKEAFLGSYKFMCLALEKAVEQELITPEEGIKATDSIESYIKGNLTLRAALAISKTKTKKTHTQIFRDWKNRPRLGGI